MQTTLTVRLSEAEAKDPDVLCSSAGKSGSEVVRDALRSYRLREALRQSQTRLAPLARAADWLAEDDILQDVS